MMEAIEDIPEQAILGGLSWKWESYGEYLDEIEKLNPSINLADSSDTAPQEPM